jgi:hypothetical protein
MLDVDDVTTQGDNACAGYADRNDFAITLSASTDVIVPYDCNEGPERVRFDVVDVGNGCPNCPSVLLGGCWDEAEGPHIGTWAQYYNCQWVWDVHATGFVTYGVCFDNFTNVCRINDIDPNDVTEEHLRSVIHALMQPGEPNANANCWACSQLHEQTHQDAYVDYLNEQASLLPDHPSMNPIDVDCIWEPHCRVTEGRHQGPLQARVYEIYLNARAAVRNAEDEAIEAATQCNWGVACDLCDYAASQGWSIEDCNCCL